MERSSLFSICPSCRVRARIQPTPGAFRCLSCNFDFASLASDEAAMNRWMEENLRDGSFEMTITLHHLFANRPEPESRAHVLAFAEQQGIAMPKTRGCSLLAALALIGVLLLAGTVTLLGGG
jgi:hypothetical protein